GAVAGLGRLLDRVLHRLDDDPAVDRLLARDRICDLQKLQPVCTDCNGHVSTSVAYSSCGGSEPPLPFEPFFARLSASLTSSSVRTSFASAIRSTGTPSTWVPC